MQLSLSANRGQGFQTGVSLAAGLLDRQAPR